jgi:hypothetical protein
MTDQEFDAYLGSALAELKSKQRYLETEFGLGRYDRFFVDYEKEELQFFSGDQVTLCFSIIAVGSHVPAKNSWRWSWSNPSLPDSIRKKASAVQQLSEITGFDLFRQPAASVDEAMAWEFVALSCRLFCAMGAYSMPQQHLRAYVLLASIVKGPNQPPEPTAFGGGSS